MADIRSQIAQLLDHPQEWVNTLWKGLVLKIKKSTDAFLWDVFDLTNLQLKWIDFIENFQNIKNHNFLVFQNSLYNPSILIANCSAHRPPIEMSLYFLESSGQELSIKYWLISVSCLQVELLTIKDVYKISSPCPPDRILYGVDRFSHILGGYRKP